jgi:hypothetical protein
LNEAIARQEHENSMDIILHSPIEINLDEKDIAKIDDEVHNELNTLFAISMSLADDYSMKSVEIGDSHSMELDVIPLASWPPVTCYTKQYWEADDLLVGCFSCSLLVLLLFSPFPITYLSSFLSYT